MTKKTAKISPKSTTNIVPLGDRVLVKPMSSEELKGTKKVDFGIIIPDTVSKERGGQGKVIAVGEGRHIDGKLVPVAVKPGDAVVFSKYSYDEVEYDGEEYYLLKEENILAILK
jgi:chaperonin GroES